jgi:hypothetical protein
MNRRNMLQRLTFGFAALLVSGPSLFMAGCTWSSVESAIAAYVPVGLAAFNGVLMLLSAAGVIPPGTSTAIGALVVLIKAGFADLLAAVQEYQNAPAAQKVTFKEKIAELLTVLGDNIQKFMTDISVSDNKLLQLVTGLVSLILTALAGFSAQLPAPLAGRKKLTVGGKPITPKLISLKDFKRQYNQLAGAASHPEIELH